MQIEDMVNAILEGREPMIDGREGRLSLEVVEALYTSANEERVVRFENNGKPQA